MGLLAVASLFGGGDDKKSAPKPAPTPEPVARVAQPEPTGTETTRTKRGVVTRAGRADQLVSGRPGATTRSGVNIPGA